MIYNFFNAPPTPEKAVQMFSLFHLGTILFLGLIVYLLYRFKDNIRNWKHESKLRYALIIILLFSEYGFMINSWVVGEIGLPFHLCGFSLILTIILLATGSYRAFEILIFTGVLGGLISFIVPDNHDYGYNSIKFYSFYYNHTIMIVAPMYYLFAYKYKVTKRSLIKAFLFMVAAWVFDYIVNTIIRSVSEHDANFMYTHELPEPLVGILPGWPWYIPIFGLIAVFMYGVFYLIFREKPTNN